MSLREKREQCLPRKNPLERPDYIEAEVQALRAVWEGRASERQQRMAMEWLITAFGTHDTSFRPGDQYLSAFAEGRRHAGTTIVYMLKEAPTRTDPDKIAVRSAGEQGND